MISTLKNTAVGIFTIVRSMWMVNSHMTRPRDTILYPGTACAGTATFSVVALF